MSITITTTRKQILSTIANSARLCAQEDPNLRDSQCFPGERSETNDFLQRMKDGIPETDRLRGFRCWVPDSAAFF